VTLKDIKPVNRTRQRNSRLFEYKKQLPPGLSRAEARVFMNDLAAQEAYLAALPKVFTVAAAARSAGVTYNIVGRWRLESDSFLERERQAREQCADALESEAVKRAVKGERKPVFQGGLLAGYTTEKSDPLLAMLLKGAKPDKYRDRSEVTIKPVVKVVAGFDPEDVL